MAQVITLSRRMFMTGKVDAFKSQTFITLQKRTGIQMSSVHPASVGGSSQSQVPKSSTTTDGNRAAVGSNDTVYPEQRHAGKVGYGPNYQMGPTFGDKLKGIEEEIKGKLTHNPALVQHGKERKTGLLKKREREKDMNEDHFTAPADDKKGNPGPGQASAGNEKGQEEQATNVVPESTTESKGDRK
ncbi:hypothetical protein DXG03_005524 [Asterophora parasitica]|uniref:Uncharacterized protein n=1 Tax=Asterophora parasitica TaxID=117018 RepID=A0A9P7KBF4_9AGAR|nr:hypothetical protein DXG03_005524 [Asterophora parasitica]